MKLGELSAMESVTRGTSLIIVWEPLDLTIPYEKNLPFSYPLMCTQKTASIKAVTKPGVPFKIVII